jgi:hypothetical protein
VDAIGRETDSPGACRVLARHISLIEAESIVGSLIDGDPQAIERKSKTLTADPGGSSR